MRAHALALWLVAAPACLAADSAAPDLARTEFADAVAVAEKAGATRFAFTLAYTDYSVTPNKTYRARFDPRLPKGERFALIEPARETLTKDERKAFERISRNDDADDALVYDGLAEDLASAKLESATEKEAIFRLRIADADLSKEAAQALEARAWLDRAGGYVAAIEIRAIRPFKPAPVAKVEKMNQRMTYARVGPAGLPVLVETRTQAQGSAVFKAFAEDARIVYADVEAVEAPPREKKRAGK